MEFFREPDPQIEQLPYGLTMGMILSAPMVVIGIALILYSARTSADRDHVDSDSASPHAHLSRRER
jgi:prolipoprotein diacylglyceryltransferase